VNSANQNATKYATDVNQAIVRLVIEWRQFPSNKAKKQLECLCCGWDRHRWTPDAQSVNDQATRVEFTGRITGAEITQKAANDSARLQAFSAIISRMGAKLAQDIEKGMEMRY